MGTQVGKEASERKKGFQEEGGSGRRGFRKKRERRKGKMKTEE
jgi:hypothetical protein